MGINVYYVIVSIYGWVHWTVYRKDKDVELPITTTKGKEYLMLFLSTLLLYFTIFYILNSHTDSDVPHLDAFTTSASITATWMLARKMLEHWIVWVAVDAVSVGLYIYKELYPTSFLYFVYATMAVVGYIQWKKKWAVQLENAS